MDGELEDVVIVGGGDIGLLTALSVQKLNPKLAVTVVDDFDHDPPQVGKSTFKKIQNILHGTLDIDERRFIGEVRPVWKGALYFRDWCDCPAFHYPFDPEDKYPERDTADAIEYYYHHYANLYDSPDHLTKGEAIVDKEKSPWHFDAAGNLDRYEKVAYHLNLKRFASFLRDVCRERDVTLVDDEITAVETTGDHIDRIRSDTRSYDADLYVDATGFTRVLRREQDGATFRDFNFPLDSAFNVRIDRNLSEVLPATAVDSGDHGWFWQIDTYDNRDLGYVYSSGHVDDETAMDEFVDHVEAVAPQSNPHPDVSPDDVAKYEFDSGYFERSWIENCIAIGNAQGFVEPLQSTGLTGNATAATQLANMLSVHGGIADDDVREQYNTWVRRVWESIYDFIAIHYRYATGDTAFWHDIATKEFSPRVDDIVEQFDRNGLDREVVPLADDTDLLELSIFFLPDFYTMMRNLGADSVFYETTDIDVSDDVVAERDQYYEQIDAEVDDYLTTEELYTGVLNF